MGLPTEIKAIIMDMTWGAQHYRNFRPALEQISLIRRKHYKTENMDYVTIISWNLGMTVPHFVLNGDRFWKFSYIYLDGERFQPMPITSFLPAWN